jgi:general secretion pathway protein E
MPPHVAPVVVSRIKVMARLDIAERRVPQDGRIGLTLGGKLLDVRVSTLPSRAGERVVSGSSTRTMPGSISTASECRRASMRSISTLSRAERDHPRHRPDRIGQDDQPLCRPQAAQRRQPQHPHRRGSGRICGRRVGQTQVNAKVGFSFATGLRAILRQDPDVVMVGEIRDRETADVAVQASLTGHLVLSTVHTNDAVGAITRMRDMKIEPFLLASTLAPLSPSGCAQALPACRAPAEAGCGRRLLGMDRATRI